MRDRVLPPMYQLNLPSSKGAILTVFTSPDSKTGRKQDLLETLWLARSIAYFAFPSSDEGLNCFRRLPGGLVAFLSGFGYETWRPRSLP